MTEIESVTPNPLPLRLREVKTERDRLLNGLVLSPTSDIEGYDVSNAAQSIVLDHLLGRLMDQWVSPELEGTGNFYNRFAQTYYKYVLAEEDKIWQSLVQRLVSDMSIDLNQLTPFEAAAFTLVGLANSVEVTPATSHELFVEVAQHAAVIETKCKEQTDLYTEEKFYSLLRKSLPPFLKRLIALDSVITDLYRHNVVVREETTETQNFDYLTATLDHRFFKLESDAVFIVSPHLLKALKQHAQEHNFTQDHIGRTENRGCPFLVSKIQDEFIAFAIEEFIQQHKKFLGTS